MRKSLWILLIPVMVLVLVVLTALSPAEDIDRTFHQSFQVKPGDRLQLQHGDGDVEILPWDKDELDVEVGYLGNFTAIGMGTGESDFDVIFRQVGQDIRVVGKEIGSGIMLGYYYRQTETYTYTIRAPAYLELQLKGDDGNVTIASWRAPIACTLDDADITLSDVESSSTRVTLDEGHLLVDGYAGDFEAIVDDGTVSLLQHRAGRLTVRTDDADIDLQLLAGDDLNLDVRTDDGTVTIDLEPGLSTAYSIDTDDGLLEVDLPQATTLEDSMQRITGEIHGGQGSIRIRTDKGDVTLRESR